MSTNILRLTCPECDTALSLKTAPAGGRCKCPKCGTTFATAAAALPEAKPTVSKPAPATIQKAPPAKTKAVPARSVKTKLDDDDVVLAAKPAKKGSNLTLMLAGGGAVVVVGFLCLMLLGGIIGLVVWRSGKSSTDGKTDQVASTANPNGQQNPPANQFVNNPGDGSLPGDVLQRTKQATLLIKVTMPSGQQASGSGFFEDSSGLIVTNAHVVGMLEASSPPPRQIDVVVNSGLPNTMTVSAKLIVVDRTSDLALLEVPAAPGQSRLKVALSKDLRETQPVYVCGFPLGEQANKNLTINKTTVSSLHRGNDGIVNKVQVNGGMDHGNSGGPVIDSQGNVVGVSFSGYEDSSVKFAIPGESVHALLQGRVSGISVNNEAVSRAGRLYVPVSVSTLDPRRQIRRIAFDYWVGPANQTPPGPSDQQPNVGNTVTPRRTVEATYDAGQQTARAELVLDSLPDSNNRLWIQPVATNGSGRTAWLGGTSYEVDPPVEPRPAMLQAQFRQGPPTSVRLTSTARFKVKEGDESESKLQNLESTLQEQIKALTPGGGAQVELTVRKFATGVSKNNQPVATTPEWQQATSKDIGFLALEHDLDPKGNYRMKRVDYLGQVSSISRKQLDPIGKQLNQSFEMVSLPLPGKQMQPGQMWQGKRELPTPLELDKYLNSVPINMTYTYRGVRQYNGRSIAVVDVSGVFKERAPSRRGITLFIDVNVRGAVMVDPDTGMVVSAKALTNTTLTVRRGSDSAEISGTLDIRLQRTN